MIIDVTLPADIFCLATFHMNADGKTEMKELMGIYLCFDKYEVDITNAVLPNLELMNAIEATLRKRCEHQMVSLSRPALVRLGMVK